MLRCIACYNKNEYERAMSSSGGIAALIVRQVIKEGGAVFGAAFDEDFSVRHIMIEKEEDIEKLAGSKYTISKLQDAYSKCKEELDKGRKILFTGTPCQIGGLKNYLKCDHENLITADIVCHGTPMGDLWAEYLREMAGDRKVAKVNFRDKTDGWKHFDMYIEYSDGSFYRADHDKDLYMRGFLTNTTLTYGCYRCRFKGEANRRSDITLGDLWGIDDMAPEMNDNKGTSLVFVNTEKGAELIRSVEDMMQVKDVDPSIAVLHNTAAERSVYPGIYREHFIRAYKKNNDLIKCLKRYYEPDLIQMCLNKLYRMRRGSK